MQLESNNFLIRKRRNGLFSQKMQLLESDYSNKFSDSAFFESFLWLFLVKALTLRVQPPSFLTLPELENGKSDWAEIFTIDRARKIRGHVFERFFFLWPLPSFFWQKRFSSGHGLWYEELVRLGWNFYQRWPWPFLRTLFFCFQFAPPLQRL